MTIPSQSNQIAEARRLAERRIAELRAGDHIEQIQAYLMDSCCGELGMSESSARIRANGIFTLIQEWKR